MLNQTSGKSSKNAAADKTAVKVSSSKSFAGNTADKEASEHLLSNGTNSDGSSRDDDSRSSSSSSSIIITTSDEVYARKYNNDDNNKFWLHEVLMKHLSSDLFTRQVSIKVSKYALVFQKVTKQSRSSSGCSIGVVGAKVLLSMFTRSCRARKK